MPQRKFPVGCLSVILLFIFLVVFVIYVFIQLDKADKRAEMAEEKYQAIKAIEPSEAAETNKTFLDRFFNYSSTKARYEGVKELMTDAGYQSLFPSNGPDAPEFEENDVVSQMTDLKVFEYHPQLTTVEFINEFTLTITFNDVSNTQTVLVRTLLENPNGQAWKVTDFEFIGELTGRNGQGEKGEVK